MTASEYEYAIFDCVSAYCVLSTEYQYLKIFGAPVARDTRGSVRQYTAVAVYGSVRHCTAVYGQVPLGPGSEYFFCRLRMSMLSKTEY